MQIHELKRKNKQKKSIQVGRGGRRGKTSGKGHKGQRAHSGGGPRPEIRDAIKKYPKLRGRGVNINKPIQDNSATVTLSDLEKNFKDGDKVTPLVLYKTGLVRKSRGLLPSIKIVGTGELKKKLTVVGVSMTVAAEKAINKK